MRFPGPFPKSERAAYSLGYTSQRWDNLTGEESIPLENLHGATDYFWMGWNDAYEGKAPKDFGWGGSLNDSFRSCLQAITRGLPPEGRWFWPTAKMIDHFTAKTF